MDACPTLKGARASEVQAYVVRECLPDAKVKRVRGFAEVIEAVLIMRFLEAHGERVSNRRCSKLQQPPQQ